MEEANATEMQARHFSRSNTSLIKPGAGVSDVRIPIKTHLEFLLYNIFVYLKIIFPNNELNDHDIMHNLQLTFYAIFSCTLSWQIICYDNIISLNKELEL